MPDALDPRWQSKESLVTCIKELVVASGAKIRRLGKSDCFEVEIEGKKNILLAIKESGKEKPPHRETPTMWVGVPPLILNRAFEFVDQPVKPHLVFLVIDHWDKHLLVIPSRAALGTMVHRKRKAIELHFSFNVKKTLHGYSVQTSLAEPDIPIEHVDTLEPLAVLLTGSSPV